MALQLTELREILKMECEAQLISRFLGKGFELHDRPNYRRSHIIVNPFKDLIRVTNDVTQAVIIDFDKYARPAFRLHFGEIPRTAFSGVNGHTVGPNSTDLLAVPITYNLYDSRFRLQFFKLGFLKPKTEKSIHQFVAKAARLTDEVFNWFETGEIEAHVWARDLSFVSKSMSG